MPANKRYSAEWNDLRGNVPARLYSRSLNCLFGLGVPKNPEKAFVLNMKAAESGFHDAVLAAGWFYLNGVGVEKDLHQAKHWYRKAARQGDSGAIFSIGQIAHDQRDYADALVWFSRAVDHGHARSYF